MLIVRSGLLTATNWAAEGSKYPYAFQETTLIFDSLLDSGFNSCSPVITLSATQLSNSNDTILFGIATNKEAKGVLLFVVRGSGSGSSLVSILFQVDSVAEGFRKALKTRCPCLRCITGISLRHAKQAPKQPASLTLPNIRVLDLDRGSISQPLDATPHLRTQPRARSSGGIKALASQASNLLRFVFGVNQIKSTATSIRTMISAGLTCGEKHVDKLSPMIVKKLEKFEVTLGRSFGVSGNASSIPERPHRPSISKANRTSSYSVPSPLPDKIAPCINPINAATTNVLVFLLQTLRSTNLFSINDIIAGLVFLVGSLLLAVCQKARVIVRSKLTKFGRVLLESLRGALFTPIASWRIVGILPRKWGWTVRPVDAVAFILAFLVNLASYLVEGTAPTRIAAFNYKASLDSDLKDSVSTAAFTDIKDYLGISINTIKALQVPTDIFAEPEIPVFGLGELILRIIILTIQFPRNKDVPGYTKRVAFFACWASETITYHFLLILNLGHVLISSRTLAAIQLIISVLGFSLAASMHWADLQALGKEGLAHARMMIYLSFSSCLLGSIGGFAAKAGIILPYPSSRTTCAVVVAVANKANGVVQTTLKVHRKYKAA